ncbi:MAG: hypothetical protein HY063_15290 [Bacteroidetes bacterium]|nr:hypothetical protein [Bacteroidota bacterium]
MRKKKLFIALLIILTIGLGFLRDYVFVHINEKTGQGLAGISNHEQRELFMLKWLLTFAFAFLYFGAAVLFLHLLFKKKKYFQLTALIYAALILISVFTGATGYFFFSFEKAYPFIRTVMGIAQSPIVLMILIPACLINESKLFIK